MSKKKEIRTPDPVMYEAWQSSDDLTFSSSEGIKDMKRKGLVSSKAKMIFSIRTDSWNHAMTKYHEHMGWAPYVPF